MINRRNFTLVREHLAYLRDVYHLSAVSLERYWFYLRHLLFWAGEVYLGKCAGIRPTFPAYVAALPGSREGSRTWAGCRVFRRGRLPVSGSGKISAPSQLVFSIIDISKL